MSRYAEAHKTRTGPGDARPTALQVVEDEGLIGKLTDKVFLVTGTSSGIGIETLRTFYATGAHVIGTVRNMTKGQQVVDDIQETMKGGKITLIEMEMDSLASIKKGAAQIMEQANQLNVLVCNAGVMATPEGKTKDGFETQFGTNHIGHFYLFQLLKPLLLRSATPSFPSRVVSVSSIGHRTAGVRFSDYNFTEKDSYKPWEAYGQAKTANILFSNYIERHYGARGLHSTSLHPGGIMTGLQVYVDPAQKAQWDKPEIRAYMKDPAQGAATSVYAALSEEWKHKGGRYLSDCVEQAACKGGDAISSPGDDGYAEWAYDVEGEEKLWRDSLKMVGMSEDNE
ncbi:NAD(P)-binding protein [Hortaea werneckii]|nr:NAD(P)-binding protein [Hortaea werneckii]KAI7710451.1 NAD(P)-binding protein [Hortaea werneckii]